MFADDDDGTARWTGTAQVRIVDPDGAPVEGAYALIGGAPSSSWATTDADGNASVQVDDDGISDRWLLADKVGYTAGGDDLDDEEGPHGRVEIVIYPLPAASADNPDYHFQPGGDGSSLDMSECGHCHRTIGDDWSTSPHREAGRNEHIWDQYVGGRAMTSEECDDLGGWFAEGQQPGVDGGLLERCYLGGGVLPFLNEDCGAPGEQACDHPEHADSLTAFGSCGDCHVPAYEGVDAGSIDLARATGIAHDEGVTCDLCHKIRQVQAGSAPGRDGGLQLQRPSEDTIVFGQDFDPITFGPYPDVPLAVMKGSYTPGMREAGWCSGCHEYSRATLHPDHPVDADRWPDGLPIINTYTEYAAGPYADTVDTCQLCHMEPLDEESSTYDITPQGLVPSFDQGWLRASGEVRHHTFGGSADMHIPDFELELTGQGGEVEAMATIANAHAGHGIPTGSPLRQLMVRFDATDGDGVVVPAIGGRSIPDVGGWRHQGEVDAGVVVAGNELVFSGQTLAGATVARFVRPTGAWDDYDGPGTGSFEGLSAPEKGLPIHQVIGERSIQSLSGDTALLADPPPALEPGDRVYLVGPGDAAGAPGWLYGKVFVDADGNRGVAHYRAVDLASDNRIASEASAVSTVRFPVPESGELTVVARLVYRRYAAGVAGPLGWDVEDEELTANTRNYSD